MPEGGEAARRTGRLALAVLLALAVGWGAEAGTRRGGVGTVARRTEVRIEGDRFIINGRPTYAGRRWQGHRIEGLLMNSRMVQGIFDDLNPETRSLWAYPDTRRWDPERNTREFVAAMPEWHRHGLLAFTLNLQGGSPQGYSRAQPWHNSAFEPDGALRPAYMARLERILDRADSLGMAVLLGVFYFAQDQRLRDEAAVKRALDNAVDWVLERGYGNVLIEVNNECNVRYDHAVLRPGRVHELIERVRSRARGGRRLLAGTSYGGGTIPAENVVRASDFLLLHGNGVSDPDRIAAMVRAARQVPGYRPMPILFNEDDHFGFDRPTCNMTAAVGEYASWGFLDFRRKGEGFAEGYQSVPVDWGISSARKRAFFAKLAEVTGVRPSRARKDVYPGVHWETRTPAEAGMDAARLDALRDLVGGRGCVVRHGALVYAWGDQAQARDVASAVKPLTSTLLLLAIQEGKLKGVDARVADVVPGLAQLNDGRDAAITWRHLASQTSGYGLEEPPGRAWAYNDYAIALYYDALMQGVYRDDGTHVLKSRLADVLQFEDRFTFNAFGTGDRAGRLAVSVRDFARFGLLWLRGGRWRDRQVLRPDLARLALTSVVPATTPRSSGRETPMLPGQRTLGGGKNQTPAGPGCYSFNWWVNGLDGRGRRMYPTGPPDLYVASGHGGRRAVWVIPSLDLVVSWNDSVVDDNDESPGNPNTRCSQAVRLMVEACRA
ncbi:MAG: beta-lactamase family protein [Chthonomonadales bacterium]|nr:beta-lactamase family protein [Chthonomonadales bacterium]